MTPSQNSKRSGLIFQAVAFVLVLCPNTNAANPPQSAQVQKPQPAQTQSALQQSAALQMAAMQYAGQSAAPNQMPAPINTPDPAIEASKLNSRAESLAQKGQGKEAAVLSRKALAIMERRFGPYNTQLAPVLNTLARATELEGNKTEAETLYKRAIGIYEASLGPTSQEAAITRINLANLLTETGNAQEAQQQYEQALPVLEKALGDDPNLASAISNLAGLYEKGHNFARAAQLYEKAGFNLEKSAGKMSMKLVPVSRQLAECYAKQNRPDLAEPNFVRIVMITEACMGRDHTDLAIALNDLAFSMAQQGKLQTAQPLWERALAILDREQKQDVTACQAQVLSRLAQAYAAANRAMEAELLYKRALPLEEKLGSDSLADDLRGLGTVYARSKQWAQAETQFAKALAILERSCSQDDPRLTTVTNELAAVYEAEGKQLEALTLYERTAAVSGAPRHTIAQSATPIEESYTPVAQKQVVQKQTRGQEFKNKMGVLLRGMGDSIKYQLTGK